MIDFLCALNGKKGELDAWLEVNNEAEVKAHILELVERTKQDILLSLENKSKNP